MNQWRAIEQKYCKLPVVVAAVVMIVTVMVVTKVMVMTPVLLHVYCPLWRSSLCNVL